MSVQNAIRIRIKNGVQTAAVPSIEIMDELFHTSLPSATSSFSAIIKQLQDYTKQQFSIKSTTLKQPTGSAFNNCNGRWAEYVYAAYAWDRLAALNSADDAQYIYVYVKLPNNNSDDNEWISLLNQDYLTSLNRLERDEHDPQVVGAGHKAFTLCSSNPDAVILKYTTEEASALRFPLDPRIPVANLAIPVMQGMDSMYGALLGTVNPHDNLQCFLSVKTSIRPDRRYQFVHEGNNIKAILLSLIAARIDARCTQDDVQRKYFAVAFSKISKKDKIAMETALSACIAVPAMNCIWSVDKLYECLTPGAVASQIDEMIA